MTDLETILAATRYEKIRKLSAGEYSRIWNDCLANETPFDDAIDALPEPFRTKMREKPRTCQTCKHWSNNLKKKPKFVATSTGKCKEIFKELTASDSDLESYLPFFEDLTTRDTFGCNGYEQANNGNL